MIGVLLLNTGYVTELRGKTMTVNIKDILKSGDVTRFHSVPNMAAQKNSEHSWGVAVLCWYFKPDCSRNLILKALTHDCAELITGDTPATVKWSDPKIKEVLDAIEDKVEFEWGIGTFIINDEEKELLKFCDMIEGMNYCLNQRECGNRAAEFPFSQWAEAILKRFKGTLTHTQLTMYTNLMKAMESHQQYTGTL